jgi:osmotically-inducible protein OsmY
LVRGRLAAVALAVTGATFLPGCAALLIGGAVAVSAMVYTDRRSSAAQLEDEVIEVKGANRATEMFGERARVEVTSYNRIVLLAGEVPTEADKVSFQQNISKVENVRSVVNELMIGAPRSAKGVSDDAVLTSKVKASLIDAKDLFSNAIKVVTSNAVVYLMGRVTQREADRAAEVARGVSGVRKVVKVFEIVSDAELANSAQPPAAQSAPAQPAPVQSPPAQSAPAQPTVKP